MPRLARKEVTQMPRPVREPNLQLQMLIEEAGFSHKGIARRVNDLGEQKGFRVCHMTIAQ
jgi:hypothetical protein